MVRGSGDESTNAAFGNAIAARNEVLKRIRKRKSIPISDIQSISKSHGAQVTRVLEMLQLEKHCSVDFKKNIFRCEV